MSRITKKQDDGYTLAEPYLNWSNGVWRSWNKLGQLEDIEEELGIDLLTLFKALKNGAYIPFYGQVMSLERYKFDFPNKRFIAKCFNGNEWEETLYFKDYGKTWALTKEELK